MKSRLAMMAMLVSGLLMSGTGATLAVSDTSTNAAQQQYPQNVAPDTTTTPTTPAPAGDVLPQESSGGQPAPEADTPSAAPEAAPKDEVAPTTREQGAQPAEQVAASGGGTLPFTGFAAIPILVGGIALMGGGLVMRRRTAA